MRRGTPPTFIFAFVLLALVMFGLAAYAIYVHYFRLHVPVPKSVKLGTEMPPYITGNVVLVGNDGTVSVPATYNCSYSGTCTYTLNVPMAATWAWPGMHFVNDTTTASSTTSTTNNNADLGVYYYFIVTGTRQTTPGNGQTFNIGNTITMITQVQGTPDSFIKIESINNVPLPANITMKFRAMGSGSTQHIIRVGFSNTYFIYQYSPYIGVYAKKLKTPNSGAVIATGLPDTWDELVTMQLYVTATEAKLYINDTLVADVHDTFYPAPLRIEVDATAGAKAGLDIYYIYVNAKSVNVTVMGKTYSLMPGTHTISYTVNATQVITAVLSGNTANVSAVSGYIVYEGANYTTLCLTPGQAWLDNVVYAISNDPANMYYLKYYVPVAKYEVKPFKLDCTQTNCNVNFTVELLGAKNVTELTSITVYNVTGKKLVPGVNVVTTSYDASNVPYLVYVPEVAKVALVVDSKANTYIQSRQAITAYPSLTGSLILTNDGNVTLDNLHLIIHLYGGNVDIRKDVVLDPIPPNGQKQVILDYLGVPLPKPGVYKLAIAVSYDPEGTTYYLLKKELDFVIGYRLNVILDRDATVIVKNIETGETLKAETQGHKATFVVTPGTYLVQAGNVVKKVVVYDNDVNVVLYLTNRISDVSKTTYARYIAIGLGVLVLLTILLLRRGGRK